MTAPTNNAALRAALELAAGRLHWAATANPGVTAAAGRDLVLGWEQDARAALAAAIPPDQDGYAEGSVAKAYICINNLSGRLHRSEITAADHSEKVMAILSDLAAIPATDRHAEGRIAGLKAIADRLIDQHDEPWPGGTESDRLHYWRDKAINAGNELRTIVNGGTAAVAPLSTPTPTEK